MKEKWMELKKYMPLLGELVIRDIKVRYRRAALGILWTVLTPLLTMMVMTLLFSKLFINDIQNFAVYYFTGYILYSFCNESTMTALRSVIDNQNLIKKVYIPTYLFPLSKIASALMNLLFSFIALLIVMLFTGAVFHPAIFLSVIVVFFLAVFCLGLGMILCTMFVFFRDIGHFYGVVTLLWMYLTPIFYPASLLESTAPLLLKCNPLYYYIGAFRSLIMDGKMPSLQICLLGIAAAAAMLAAGAYVFEKRKKEFILYI